MDIHGKMSWTLGPNLRRKTVSCPCIRFLCFPPSPPPPPCALLPYLRACHAPVFIVGIILFDCLRIFFLIVFFWYVYKCLHMFTFGLGLLWLVYSFARWFWKWTSWFYECARIFGRNNVYAFQCALFQLWAFHQIPLQFVFVTFLNLQTHINFKNWIFKFCLPSTLSAYIGWKMLHAHDNLKICPK